MKILKANSEDKLYKYQNKLVAMILNKQQESLKKTEGCYTPTILLDNGRILWHDMNTLNGKYSKLTSFSLTFINFFHLLLDPPYNHQSGKYNTIPIPFKLYENEWSQIGKQTKMMDIEIEIKHMESLLLQHISHSKTLFQQINNCPDWVLETIFNNHINQTQLQYMNTIMNTIMGESHYYDHNDVDDGCVQIGSELVLFNATIESSKILRNYYTQIINNNELYPSEYISLIKDSMKLLLRSLIDSYSLVTIHNDMNNNMKSTDLILSNNVVQYLSYLSNHVLSLSRHLITAPMKLSTNKLLLKNDNLLSNNNVLANQLLPDIITATKIYVTLYVVKTHHSYSQLSEYMGDNNGFDYKTFVNEILKLRLNNQDYTVNLHIIDAIDERDLILGLKLCHRRTIKVNELEISDTYEYLNVKCVLSMVQHYDDELLTQIKPEDNINMMKHIVSYFTVFIR